MPPPAESTSNRSGLGAQFSALGRFVFRFATAASAHLQKAEAELARAFCEVHGALPCYNIVTPSGGRPS